MSTQWQFVGPRGFAIGPGLPARSGSPVSGRVNAVAYHPVDPNIRYLGAAGGGVWKTIDAGASWQPLSDSWPSQCVSSIAIDPANPDRIYVGTGDWPNQSGPSIGVMRSDDGGARWETTLSTNTLISCVAAHPDVAGVAFAAEWAGALRRFDGSSWSVPKGLEDFQSAWWMGIVFGHPVDGMRPCYAICEGDGGTIFRSVDAGASWTPIAYPNYPNVSGWQQRSMLVTSPTIPGRLYLCLPNQASAVFQGDDASGTVTWTDITGFFNPHQAAWNYDDLYAFSMACGSSVINGAAHDVLYVGRGEIWLRVIGHPSIMGWECPANADNATAGVFFSHADQHALVTHPHNPAVLLAGCDGGIYELTYDGQSFFTTHMSSLSLNDQLGITQCYKIASSPDGQWSLAGAQDVGSPVVLPGGAMGGATNGGDGGACAINPHNPLIQYSTGDFNGVFRRTADGWITYLANGAANGAAPGYKDIALGVGADERMWTASPMVLDPSHSNLLYLATNYLYRWNEATQSVEARLGGQSLSKEGWINGIAVATADSNRIYTCSNMGEVFMSRDAGKTWTDITANLPSGSFNTISAANPAAANDVLVGIEVPSSGGRLWRCTDPTNPAPVWTDVSGTAWGSALPAAPVHAIVRDRSNPGLTWYVATLQGVYQTTTAGAQWTEWWTSLGAPPVATMDLIQVGKRLRAGTFGRGIWEYFPGTLQLFYRGGDRAVWSRWRTPDGNWSGEQRLGGVLTGNPTAAVVPVANVLQLFYRGADSALWSRWRNPDGSWSGEQRLGGILTSDPIAAVIPGSNVLQVFYRGKDQGVWSRWRTPDGKWSAEQRIRGVLTSDPIVAVVPVANVLQLFYRGQDSALWSRWRNLDGNWSKEQRLGGTLSNDPIAAVIPGTNTLQLFYRGAGSALWSRWRNPDGSWSEEQQLGGTLTGVPAAAVVPVANVLQLFYRGADSALWSRWRNPDGSWSGEQRLGGILMSNPIAAVVPGTNVLQVFYRGADSALWSRWRNPDGSWSEEQRLGGALFSNPIAAVIPE